MRRILFTLIQLTWGLPQTLLGFILYLYWLPRTQTRYVYHGAIVTEWTTGGGISLGLFVFVSAKIRQQVLDGQIVSAEEGQARVRVHEYGHCVQSLLLGPLYLIVIGIPSWLWCNLPPMRRLRKEKGIPYDAAYMERWATAWGEKFAARTGD